MIGSNIIGGSNLIIKKIYEIQNIGKGEITTIVPENLLLLKDASNLPLWMAGNGYGSITTSTGVNEAIGNYSVAIGFQTVAQGDTSYSEGRANVSNGSNSHSEGQYNEANGLYSHASGYNTYANGEGSYTEGIWSEASGDWSHCEGSNSQANGTASHAEGESTYADGTFSHSEGFGTEANGDQSHAEGSNTRAVGTSSHAEGEGTEANGDYSHAEGYGSIAHDRLCHAEGNQTEAFSGSHSEGDNTRALGTFCHTEGNNTTADGTSSHAQGQGTLANGTGTHAGGSLSQAIGDYSFVHGNNSLANGNSILVLGSNLTGSSDNTTYVENLNIKNSGKISIGNTHIDEPTLAITSASLSTGLYEFTNNGITFSDPATFNLGAVKGWIVDSRDVLNANPFFIDFAGGSGLTTPYMSTSPASYLMINSANTVTILNTRPTTTQRRDNIYLGALGHTSGLIDSYGNSPDIMMNEMSQVRAMFEPIRLINDGVIAYPNATDLTMANTAGTLYGLGIGFIANGNLSPTAISVPAGAPTTFQYRTQTSGSFSDTTLIDPQQWDNNGTLNAIGGNPNTTNATNQRIYLLEDGGIRIQYGQVVYTTLPAAIAAINTEKFVLYPNNKNLGILIGILSVRKNTTNLSDTTYAQFFTVSKFGESVGASAGATTSTLQSAYNNSGDPEIITNANNGGVAIRRGSAADTDIVFETQNGAATTTFSINGNGLTSVNSLKINNLGGGTVANNLGVDASGNVIIGSAGGGGGIGGAGTTNNLAKWTSSSAIGNSLITDNGATINILTPAISGRETPFQVQISDNAIDKLMIANGTTTAGRFAPGFVGYTQGGYGSIFFRGLGAAADDLSTNTAYVTYLAANTNNSADPNNGTLTAPSARPMFTWGTLTTYMTMASTGNLILSSVAAAGAAIDNGLGDKLQVNGSIIATSIKKSGGTASQYLLADGTTTTGTTESGIYTPTIVLPSGLSALSSVYATYIRVGNIVSVNVGFSFGAVITAAAYDITISLPINKATSNQVLILGAQLYGNCSQLFGYSITSTTSTVTLSFSKTANCVETFITNVHFQYSILS